MKVTNTTRAAIEQAIEQTGHITTYNFQNVGTKGTAFRFTLRPLAKDRYFGRQSYPSMVGRERKVHAVCWHGYKEFLTHLFELSPDAVVTTALATYRGREDFLAKFPDTANHSVNSFLGITVTDGCDHDRE